MAGSGRACEKAPGTRPSDAGEAMFGMERVFGSRFRAAFVGLTLLGVVVVGGPTSAGATPLSWSITPSPLDALTPGTATTPPGIGRGPDSDFAAVSCTDSKFCVAVGSYGAQPEGTLNEVWDGTRWSVMPRSSVLNSTLAGISCVSRIFCFAVGGSTTTTNESTLTEMWDGSNWSVAISPSPGGPLDQLNSVSCLNRSWCVAVGYSTDPVDHNQRTLVESWNGAAWSVVPTPTVGIASTSLSGVSCVTRSFCIAVGTVSDPAGSGITVIERWNGTAWSLMNAPALDLSGGVSCVTTRFCMATGFGVIERWDGSSWTIVPNPLTTHPTPFYTGVSCLRPSFCVASELRGSTPGSVTGSVIAWDGTAWSIPSGAIVVGNWLNGVSCASSRFCFTVGGPRRYGHSSVAILGRP